MHSQRRAVQTYGRKVFGEFFALFIVQTHVRSTRSYTKMCSFSGECWICLLRMQLTAITAMPWPWSMSIFNCRKYALFSWMCLLPNLSSLDGVASQSEDSCKSFCACEVLSAWMKRVFTGKSHAEIFLKWNFTVSESRDQFRLKIGRPELWGSSGDGWWQRIPRRNMVCGGCSLFHISRPFVDHGVWWQYFGLPAAEK